MSFAFKTILSAALIALAASPIAAQDDAPETVPFAGGEFTITENDDYEKVLAFDGRALARAEFVMLEDSGHVALMETPEAFAKVCLEFLDRQAA